jgi:hypothetical protein
MVCLEREARESERSLLHRRLVVVSAFLSLLSLRSPSTPLAATMTTTSSSSGLTYKLHPVSAADGQEKREGKSERHRDPIGLPTPRSFAHPQKKKKHDRKQLVVVNISDHITRAKVISSSGRSSSSNSSASADAEAADATARVAGCLLGSVGGTTRTVDVANSFELVVPVAGARPDAALLRRRLDQCTLLERERERERREKKEREEDPTFLFFDPTLSHPSRDPPPRKNVSSADKQTFPALDLVGWYAVGPLSQPPGGAGTTAAAVHDALSPAEGSEAAAPFGLVFDPTALLLPGGGSSGPSAGPGGPSSARSPSRSPASVRTSVAGLPIRLWEWVPVGGGGASDGGASPAPSAAASATASAAAAAAVGGGAAAGAAGGSWSEAPFTIDSSEIERIGVAQAARAVPAGADESGTDQREF